MEKKGSGIWLIILLIILIVLVILAIIFRKQLKPVFDKIKNWFQKTFKIKKKGGAKPSPGVGGPRFPVTSSVRTVPGAVPRRITPSARPAARPAPAKPAPAKKTEFDDVLKKLKEIGK